MVSKNIKSRLIRINGESEKWDKLTLGASAASMDDVVGIVDVLESDDSSCLAFEETDVLVAGMSTWSGLT